MALGTGVHNLSLVVRAHNRASRALASVSRDLTLMEAARKKATAGFSALASVGALAIKAIGVAVAVGIGGSILAYSKFADALTTSLAIVEDVSPKMRDELENTAREVAKTTIFSANQAAEAYFHLFSAGQDVAQAMNNLPIVAAFAQAGLFDLEVATELLVTSQNALGLAFEDPIENAKQMARVADVLAAADERAVGSIQDFAEALTNRAAAAMRTYNIDVEEGTAVLAAWATQGLKGKTAGEAFAIVTRDLQKAALKEADAWRQAGAAVFDSSGNMRNMADIVGDLEAAMEGLSDANKKVLLQDLGFQERSQTRILQLLGTSEAIRQFEADFRQAGGTVERVAEKQLQSATKQLKLLGSAIVDVFIGGGKEFNEGFITLIKNIREFVNNHAKDFQDAAKAMARAVRITVAWLSSLAAHFVSVHKGLEPTTKLIHDKLGPILGTIVDLIDKLIRGWVSLSEPVKNFMKDWAKMIPIITLVAGGLKIVMAVLGFIVSPALIVAVVLAGLVTLFKHLWENSVEFRNAVGEVGKFLKNVVAPLIEEAWVAIQAAIDDFVKWFRQKALPFLIEVWEFIQVAAEALVDWFSKEALPFLKTTWDQIKETFKSAWDFIVALFEVVIAVLQWLWKTWGDTLIIILKAAWNLIKNVVEGAFKILRGIFDFFAGLLSGDWSRLWEGLKSIFSGLWQILSTVIYTAWEIFRGIVIGVWNSLAEAWKKFWREFKQVVAGPINAVLGFIEGMVNKAIDLINGLINAVNKLPGVSISNLGHVSISRISTGLLAPALRPGVAALGGRVAREGLTLVGERGPELVNLVRGSTVVPLSPRDKESVHSPMLQIDQVVFQGTPTQMLEDWKRYTRLALRGM